MTEPLIGLVDYLLNADGSRYCLDAELLQKLDGSLKSNLEELADARGWRTGSIFAPWDPRKQNPLLTLAPAGVDNPMNVDQFFAIECGVPSSFSAGGSPRMGFSESIPVKYCILWYVAGEYKGILANFERSGPDEYDPAVWAKICMNIIDAYWIAGDTSALN
jgi:hypothetical protein